MSSPWPPSLFVGSLQPLARCHSDIGGCTTPRSGESAQMALIPSQLGYGLHYSVGSCELSKYMII